MKRTTSDMQNNHRWDSDSQDAVVMSGNNLETLRGLSEFDVEQERAELEFARQIIQRKGMSRRDARKVGSPTQYGRQFS